MIKDLIIATLLAYIFGSVCAGTLNIGEWNNTGRIVLAIIWLISCSDIIANTNENHD